MIQLQNQFRVPLSVEDAWLVLTDLPKVAGCMPGAALDDVVDGEYRGHVSLRIGPVNARYRGTASFREHDEVGRRAVIEARGREERGNGSAKALVTAVLKPEGQQTLVDVLTELTVSGKAAQFGRSLLADVSNSMVDEFVHRLESMVNEGGSVGSSQGPTTTEARSPSSGSAAGADQLDVFSTLVLPLARKHARSAAVAAGMGTAGYLLGRTAGRRRASHG